MVNYVTKRRETKAERGGLCMDEDEARYFFKCVLSLAAGGPVATRAPRPVCLGRVAEQRAPAQRPAAASLPGGRARCIPACSLAHGCAGSTCAGDLGCAGAHQCPYWQQDRRLLQRLGGRQATPPLENVHSTHSAATPHMLSLACTQCQL